MSALVLNLVLAASSVHVFGIPGGDWITINSEGVVLKRFRELHGIIPDDVAISPDGKRWAMARREVDKAPQLYLFEDDGRPPRTLKGKGNVMDGLSFSADGEWVYLSANDSQSKLSHGETMSYAQVYRVNFSQPALQRASSSRGCHMWPRAASPTTVIFAHANCAGSRGLSTLSVATGKEKTLIPMSEHVREMAIHSDGSRVFYLREAVTGTEFRLLDLASGRSELWLSRAVAGARARPQWAADGERVLFQDSLRVSSVAKSGDVAVISTIEVSP